ncbi:HNH endonuclease [Mycobacterium phage MooMoo]|uniref:HNH endonuclease n=1 Tax=Mycobacterium phage MooMoo TaxID=2108127 RepID=A0A2P1JRC1_9CAUD|nr:HNH endonuclease [Mycobacterium phage MooMoo]AVO21671.1 HNH endonuclease [Mycobacterium phage MooMoo]
MRFTGFPLEVKAIAWSRCGGRCEVCGEATSDLQHHHRRARGMGSTRRPETNLPANCLMVCHLDHNRIESHRTLSYNNGWLIRSMHNPMETPVLYRGKWVLLDDDGFVYRLTEQERQVP